MFFFFFFKYTLDLVGVFDELFVFRSAQRLHALQLELTAVQLLREQLEEGIKTNEELRDALERELQRAKLGEGAAQTHPAANDGDAAT